MSRQNLTISTHGSTLGQKSYAWATIFASLDAFIHAAYQLGSILCRQVYQNIVKASLMVESVEQRQTAIVSPAGNNCNHRPSRAGCSRSRSWKATSCAGCSGSIRRRRPRPPPFPAAADGVIGRDAPVSAAKERWRRGSDSRPRHERAREQRADREPLQPRVSVSSWGNASGSKNRPSVHPPDTPLMFSIVLEAQAREVLHRLGFEDDRIDGEPDHPPRRALVRDGERTAPASRRC